MLGRQLLRRFDLQVNCTRRWLSTRKRSTASHGEAVQIASCDTNIIKSHLPDFEIPNISIPEAIWEKLDRWHDHTAVVCSATGKSYKYSELRRMSSNLARSLRAKLKLPRTSCLAVLLPNVPEYPIVVLGAMEAGLIVTTINPIYTAGEIARQLQDSGAKALVTLVNLYSVAQTATNGAIPIITIKTSQDQSTPRGAINFLEFCERETEADDIGFSNPNDIAVMPYSSGTTGLPKGVELTHKNIVSNLAQATMLTGDLIQETHGDTQQKVSCVLPMFHIYGLTVNMFKMLQLGSKLITMPRFTPETYVDMLASYKPQHLYVVPPIIIFLAAHPSVTSRHLDSITSTISGAAPLGATDVERFFDKVGKEIVSLQGYGMTEASPGITVTSIDMWKECLGSIGSCMPNTELKVVSTEDGITSLRANERGELFVRGPQVMQRYHNNPEATEEVFQDNWLRTGDMVYYDDRQILWITDRLKELIKVKGFQVAPAELEAIIRNHPSVADAAVIGVPHPISGEVPRAYIVPKAGMCIHKDEIQNFVAKQVSSYKKLDGGVSILDAIPKNPSGKILRKSLKIMYEEKGE